MARHFINSRIKLTVLAFYGLVTVVSTVVHTKKLVYTLKNFQDKGRSNHSMYLFGWGDGGQGPTEDMIERLDRLKDVDGLPKVEMATPNEFFEHIEKSDSDKLCAWHGELFFELHNGTYTSQFRTKQNNRRCEFLLHHLEAAATLAWVGGLVRCSDAKLDRFTYPTCALEKLWKLLLLNQFHDVLPGSSIGLVYRDAEAHYAKIKSTGNKLLTTAVESWIGKEDGLPTSVAVNTLSWARTEVVSMPHEEEPSSKRQKVDQLHQTDSAGNTLVMVSAPSYGYRVLEQLETTTHPVTAETKEDGLIHLSNEHLRAALDQQGRVVQLYSQGSSRNLVAKGAFCNQFVLFDDVPLYWDAWDVMDYHLETRREVNEIVCSAKLIESGPLRATVEVTLKISDKSHITQHLKLDTGSKYLQCTTKVVWHEAHKFLKVEFPVNVHAAEATYEIQMGHLKRPSTFNTSWDWAKFEVCGHKWADVSEYGFGMAVLNDSHYGWSCVHNTLRLSLLRSPKAPDENADMGTHSFSYAIMPHIGTYQDAGVVQAASALNFPLTVHTVAMKTASSGSFISVDTPAVIVETIKKSEDRDDAFVLRLYEAYGGVCSATVKLAQPCSAAYISNILEDIADNAPVGKDTDTLTLDFSAFQIMTVMVIM